MGRDGERGDPPALVLRDGPGVGDVHGPVREVPAPGRQPVPDHLVGQVTQCLAPADDAILAKEQELQIARRVGAGRPAGPGVQPRAGVARGGAQTRTKRTTTQTAASVKPSGAA
ncbi:hypothetical protein Psuf_006870 [Phytohabitans suffuscus]|uniref:Uncharacterized protein n=1 Tax=Phytohabitans suffuscus TaxID=624315 RepID=A0A6F8YB65_9ACTN|nr:hypothetical protein Psuf_006870 [Phytohabitans suffuscus]